MELGGIRLKNPVLLASGTAGFGTEISSVVDLAKVGGIILKSVTLNPRQGNPSPRIWETSCGVLNSVGLENSGVEVLVNDILPRLEGCGCAVFASIAGESEDEYARLAEILEKCARILSGIEINVSCPNVKRGGIEFGAYPETVASLVAEVTTCTGIPLFTKLSAAVSDIATVAVAAVESGSRGLSLINTLPALGIDHKRRMPRLGGVSGGLSGPAIKPVALKCVWECFRATGAPIIGSGGIMNARDAVEFMIAGARAVSVGTALLRDARVVHEIVAELPKALSESGASSASEIVGTLKTEIEDLD